MSLPHESRKSIEAYYQRHEAEKANPDSEYWMLEGARAQATLEKLLGNDYEAWAELVWPGETIDSKTWKEINKATRLAIDEAMQGQRDVTALANAANYRDESVPGSYGL